MGGKPLLVREVNPRLSRSQVEIKLVKVTGGGTKGHRGSQGGALKVTGGALKVTGRAQSQKP